MIGSVPDIAVVVLVGFALFGAKNIPQLGKSLGQGIREFKTGVRELKGDLDFGLHDEKPAKPARRSALEDAIASPSERST
jgi:sec-independent protein translocase protein TatA